MIFYDHVLKTVDILQKSHGIIISPLHEIMK